MRHYGAPAEARHRQDRAGSGGKRGLGARLGPARGGFGAAPGAVTNWPPSRHPSTRVDLFDWRPRFPVCVVFGHEVEGVRPELVERCDTHVRIPMLGLKHSLNVATAGGVVIYELLRKYRQLHAV